MHVLDKVCNFNSSFLINFSTLPRIFWNVGGKWLFFYVRASNLEHMRHFHEQKSLYREIIEVFSFPPKMVAKHWFLAWDLWHVRWLTDIMQPTADWSWKALFYMIHCRESLQGGIHTHTHPPPHTHTPTHFFPVLVTYVILCWFKKFTYFCIKLWCPSDLLKNNGSTHLLNYQVIGEYFLWFGLILITRQSMKQNQAKEVNYIRWHNFSVYKKSILQAYCKLG